MGRSITTQWKNGKPPYVLYSIIVPLNKRAMLLCQCRFFHRIKAGRPILVPGSGLQVLIVVTPCS